MHYSNTIYKKSSHVHVYYSYYMYIICIQVPSLIRSCQSAATAALTNTTTSTTDTTEGEPGSHTANGKKTKLSIPETDATNKARKVTPTTQ